MEFRWIPWEILCHASWRYETINGSLFYWIVQTTQGNHGKYKHLNKITRIVSPQYLLNFLLDAEIQEEKIP